MFFLHLVCLILCLLNVLYTFFCCNLTFGLRYSLSLKISDAQCSTCDGCPPCPFSTDAQCKTTAKADIVLLVDGSWSIGRLNFKTIRTFIARMVGVFDIGPDKVQIGEGPGALAHFFRGTDLWQWHNTSGRQMWALIWGPRYELLPEFCSLLHFFTWGHYKTKWETPETCSALTFYLNHFPGLAQYSGDPRTEWNLNAHPTRDSLLNAVANLPYKGGNTMTGKTYLNIYPMLPAYSRLMIHVQYE